MSERWWVLCWLSCPSGDSIADSMAELKSSRCSVSWRLRNTVFKVRYSTHSSHFIGVRCAQSFSRNSNASVIEAKTFCRLFNQIWLFYLNGCMEPCLRNFQQDRFKNSFSRKAFNSLKCYGISYFSDILQSVLWQPLTEEAAKETLHWNMFLCKYEPLGHTELLAGQWRSRKCCRGAARNERACLNTFSTIKTSQNCQLLTAFSRKDSGAEHHFQ